MYDSYLFVTRTNISKFCYSLPYFSTLEATYEGAIFPYLQK
jgi:hypothetical protein